MNAQPVRIADSTRVTFPLGATSGMARVLAAGPWGLIVTQTPFHPGSPDQPADTGSIAIAGQQLSVVDCRVGAVEVSSGRLVVGDDLADCPRADTWRWVVVHVLDQDADQDLDLDLAVATGAAVSLQVDAGRRQDLSVAHTAHHLAALALNATLASIWRQGIPPDSLGHPDFSALAGSATILTPTGFRDTYRINTGPPSSASSVSSGDPDAVDLADLARIVGVAVTDRIRRWLSRPAPSRTVTAGPYLSDRRWWECDLPGGTARVACGGTYAVDLGVIAGVQVAATLSPDHTELILTGTVTARPTASLPVRAGRYLHTGLRAIRH